MKKILFLLLILCVKLSAQDIRYFNPASGSKYFPLTDISGYQRYVHLDTMLFDSLQLVNRDTIASMIHDSLANLEPLPTMSPNQIHYGNFESDANFTRESGKLKFSGLFQLTYPIGSNKYNAIFGNLNASSQAAIDGSLINGYKNVFSTSTIAYCLINGNFNASNSNYTGYSFLNGEKNTQNSETIRFSFLNGYQNGENGRFVEFSFLNGYRNGASAINYASFLNGNFNASDGQLLRFSFVNGESNVIAPLRVLSSFVNGEHNVESAQYVSFSLVNGNRNGYSSKNTAYSFLNGDRNSYFATSILFSFLSGYQNGYNATSISHSISLGYQNAYNAPSLDKSIYLGYRQGYSSSGKNELAIGMKQDEALIYGKFDTEKLRINGTFEIRDTPTATLDSIYGKTNDDVTRKMAVRSLPFIPISELMNVVKYTDTSSMLNPYVMHSELIDQSVLNELDTMYNYDGSILAHGDTVKIPDIDLTNVVKYTDTSSMLTPYVQHSELIDQSVLNELDTMYNYDGSILAHGDTVKIPSVDLTNIVKYTDTSSMLNPYLMHSELIDNDTLNELDTMYNYDGSILAHGDTVKVPSVDLTNVVKYSDTLPMLTPYVMHSEIIDNDPLNEKDTMYNYDGSILAHGDTVKVPSVDLANVVKYSDTSSMLTPYVLHSEILDNDLLNEKDTMYNYDGSILAHGDTVKVPSVDLANVVKYSDTSSMLTPYVMHSEIIDNDLLNEKDTMYNYDGSILAHGDTVKVPSVDLANVVKYSDTSSMLTPYVMHSEIIDNDPLNEKDTMYNYDGSILAHGDTVKLPSVTDEFVNTIDVTGSNTKIITLGRNIGANITASFTDNQRSDGYIQNLIGLMVSGGNTENGISVTYSNSKLHFITTDQSATNEIQNFDVAELQGTDLRLSLTNDATIHTIPLAPLQSNIWSLDGTQAYYNDGVEVRSLGNNFADFHIKTPYQDWEFVVTGSTTGGNLRIKPTTNKKLQVANAATDVFFELDPADKSLIMDQLDSASGDYHDVVQNKSTGEFERAERRRVAYLTTNTTTAASSNTAIYTKISGLIKAADESNNIVLVGSNQFKINKSGLYKISVTLPLSGTSQSKEYFVGLNRNYNNGAETNLGWTKHQLIIDTAPATNVDNDVQHTTFIKNLNTAYNYSIGVKRSDTNLGSLVMFDDAVITIEFLTITP